MTDKEWKEKKAKIDADLASGKITHQQALDQYAEAAKGNESPTYQSDFMAFMGSNPQLTDAWRAEREEQLKQGAIQGKLASGLQTLVNVGFMAASANQLAKFRDAAGQLTRPSLAPVPQRDVALQQALYEARQGVMNPNAVLDPAKQGIQDAYAGAIRGNEIASGGQAGAFQAMNQVANLQRMQANLGLAPIAQDVKMQNQGNYNQLLGQRLGETQNMFQNQAQNAGQAWDRYQFGAQAVGALGQSGATNMADSAQRLANSISQGYAYAPSWIKSPGFNESDNARAQRIYAEAALRQSNRPGMSVGTSAQQARVTSRMRPQPQYPAPQVNPYQWENPLN